MGSGLLSFGHGAFFGVAAYGEALLLRHFATVPLPLLAILASLGSALLGLVLGSLCVRRSDAYFSMTTLAIAAFIYTLPFKWQSVTGGTDGLDGFMPQALLLLPGWRLESPQIATLYWLSVALLIPAALAVWALTTLTPFGNAVGLIRQNEERASFLGYDTHRVKLANYAIATWLAGLAGSFWAIDNGFISTDSIDLRLSTNVIIMAFIGGTSWFWGPLIGSAIYIFGADRLSALTQHWQLWMGLVFIGLVLVFPSGVSGLASLTAARIIGHADD